MAKATQLPSGSWRVQVYIDGKYKSITRPTKREAERAALELQLKLKRELAQVTVGQAIDDYIESKDGVLSPSTISGYKKIRRNNLQGLMDMPIDKLTETIVQRAFNEEAKRVSSRGKTTSPKTLANCRGLLSSALKIHRLEFTPTIPAKQKIIKELLTPQEILPAVVGTPVELPVLLAMCLSLSASEVVGLKAEDFKGDYVIVRHSVINVDGERIEKNTMKAYERTRMLPLPEYVCKLLRNTEAVQNGSGYIITMSGSAISKRFSRRLEKFGLPHM